MPSLGWQELLLLCFCLLIPGLPILGVVLLLKHKRAQPHVLSSPVNFGISGIQCPYCAAQLPATARFCPNCGEPRSAVRDELLRASQTTGIPYEELVKQARVVDRAAAGG